MDVNKLKIALNCCYQITENTVPSNHEQDYGLITFKLFPRRSICVGDVSALLEQDSDVIVNISEYKHYCKVYCSRKSFFSVLAMIYDKIDWFI